jgi:L-fuconolactonase
VRIDCHVHVWDLSRQAISWPTPAHGELFRSVTADEAVEAASTRGDGQLVLVQSEDTLADAKFLAQSATNQPEVLGVIPFVPLDAAGPTELALDELGAAPIVGIRHIASHAPTEAHIEALQFAAGRGLTLDVLRASSGEFDYIATIAARVPGLTIVLDHFGEPSPASFDQWRAAMALLAAFPKIVVKASGAQNILRNCPDQLEWIGRTCDIVLDLFGPQRVIYGSDWPMWTRSAADADAYAELARVFDSLSIDEQEFVGHRTARSTYELRDPQPTSDSPPPSPVPGEAR